jgi:hypothetical protein
VNQMQIWALPAYIDGTQRVLSSTSQKMGLLSNSTILYGVAAATIWWLNGAIQRRRANPTNLPLPPGPKGYPIIGSLLDFPTFRPWLTYDQWSKVYGVFRFSPDKQMLNDTQGTWSISRSLDNLSLYSVACKGHPTSLKSGPPITRTDHVSRCCLNCQ